MDAWTVVGDKISTIYVCEVCNYAIGKEDFRDYDGLYQEGCCVNDPEDREAW